MAIRTGLVRTGTEVVNWDAFRLMRCCRCVMGINNKLTDYETKNAFDYGTVKFRIKYQCPRTEEE